MLSLSLIRNVPESRALAMATLVQQSAAVRRLLQREVMDYFPGQGVKLFFSSRETGLYRRNARERREDVGHSTDAQTRPLLLTAVIFTLLA